MSQAPRLIPRIDAYPGVVRFAQGVPGKLAVLAAFALGLYLHGFPWWLDVTVILAAATFVPAHRRVLILAGTWYWLSRYTVFKWGLIRHVAAREGVVERVPWNALQPAVIVAVLAFCVGFHVLAQRLAATRFGRRPVLSLLLTYGALVVVAAHAPIGGVERTYLWAFLVVLGRYLWVLGYSLLDRKREGALGSAKNLGHFLPFWLGSTGTATPFPKGASYLRKSEAKSAEELAVAQLKGIKLIAWAGVLIGMREVLLRVAHGKLGIPWFATVFDECVAGTPCSWRAAWLALIAKFLTDLLSLAIWGHVIVATCRMAGFNVLRNTYRPLGATTIAEFWNRYYYYFKELLVEFFFYPTYFRCFKKHPRLRLFFATLVAACFGNFLYHFLRDIQHVARLGPWEALKGSHVYAFYALVLGVAIGLSQLRSRSRAGQRHWIHEKVLSPLVVLGFYCLLSVFDNPDRTLTIRDHFTFLLTLVPHA